MTIPNYRPFSNGSEFDFWKSENCHKCTKATPYIAPKSQCCALEVVLDKAAAYDGTFRLDGDNTTAQAAALADRLHWDGINCFPRRCAEFSRKEGE